RAPAASRRPACGDSITWAARAARDRVGSPCRLPTRSRRVADEGEVSMPADIAARTPRLAGLSLPLLALLAAAPPAARPPHGGSGRMAFDEVADGLRKYHKEPDPEKRLAWLQTLRATGDTPEALA